MLENNCIHKMRNKATYKQVLLDNKHKMRKKDEWEIGKVKTKKIVLVDFEKSNFDDSAKRKNLIH
jgi:hypothetical protein